MPKKILLAMLVIVLVAGLRVTLTYKSFGLTYDEATHICTGAEFIERGSYEFETLHPPLARAAAALPLWLSGLTLPPALAGAHCPRSFLANYHHIEKTIAQGYFLNPCLPRAGCFQYLSASGMDWTLLRARLGVLPFFLLSIVAVFLLGNVWIGPKTGLAAALLWSMQPFILGVSGLVLTDMAHAAMLFLSLYTASRYARTPSLRWALLSAVAASLAILSKFSALALIPISLATILMFLPPQERYPIARRLGDAGLAFVSIILIIWGAYRFSVGRAQDIFPFAQPLAIRQDFGGWLVRAPIVPMPEFFEGLISVAQKNQKGHSTYLFGTKDDQGRWYFFPSQLLLRISPLLLVLSIAGLVLMARKSLQARTLHHALPAALFLLLLLITLGSKINIGLRHAVFL